MSTNYYSYCPECGTNRVFTFDELRGCSECGKCGWADPKDLTQGERETLQNAREIMEERRELLERLA